MNKIEELIEELCPDGVEMRELGEITFTITCKNKVKLKDYTKDGVYPIVDQGKKYISGYSNIEGLPKDEYIVYGDHSENIKYVDFAFIQGADGLKILKTKDDINTKYVYYAFSEFYKKENSYKRHWSKAKETLIPIPPLKVQEEIVKILDPMIKLQESLEYEKELRIKQYNYYRDKLLSFEGREDVEWKELGEVGELIRGSGMQKKDFVESGFPSIHYGQIYTYYKTFADKTITFVSEEFANHLKKGKYGDILIAGTSENIKDVLKPLCWLGEEEVAISGDMYIYRVNKDVVKSKYITYALTTTTFDKYKERYSQGAMLKRVSKERILSYKIGVPSLSEQQKIAEILDKFEELIQLLEREIKLREKQYEYYREKLLNFNTKN